MGGLEILPIEIFLLREKSFHLSSILLLTVPYLDAFFLFWGWVLFSLSFRRCHHPGAIKKRNKDGGLRYKQQEYFALRAVIHLSIHLFVYSFLSLCSISPGWNQATGGLHTRAMCVVKTDAQLVRQSIHLGE